MTGRTFPDNEINRSRLLGVLDTNIQWGLLCVLGLIASLLYSYIILHLDRGVDVSDSAYYIINQQNFDQITMQLTLFGPLWAVYSPFDGIWANRLLLAIMLVLSYAVLSWSIIRFLKNSIVGQIAIPLFAVSSVLAAGCYYFYWFADPSYNSINLICILFGWAAFLNLLMAFDNELPARKFLIFICSFGIGLSLGVVGLTKASSALLLGPVFLIGFLFARWRFLTVKTFIILTIASLSGLVFPVPSLWVQGLDPVTIFEKMHAGYYIGTQLAEQNLNPLESLRLYTKSIQNIAVVKKLGFFIPFLVIVLVFIQIGLGFVRGKRMRVAVFILLLLMSGLLLWSLNFHNIWDRNRDYTNVALLSSLIFSWAFILSQGADKRVAAIASILTITYVIYAYGTLASWHFAFIGAAGLSVMLACITLATAQTNDRTLISIPLLMSMTLSAHSAYLNMSEHPYRLEAPMNDLTVQAPVGPGNELFWMTPDLAQFYTTLADMRSKIEQLETPPVIIDLTGRVPMTVFQLGGRLPNSPWILSGYPGSSKVFHEVISKLPINEVQSAWIFQTETYDYRFPDNILNRYGISFKKNYVPVATVPVPYMKFSATLYAPASSATQLNLKAN